MSVNNTKTGGAQHLQFFHLSQSTLPRDTPHPTHHRPLLLLMVLCMFCQQLGMFDTFAASVSEATMKYIYVQNNSTIDDSWIGTPINKKTSTPSQKSLKPISSVADIQNIPQNTDTLLISDGSWIFPGKVKKPVTNTPTEVTLNAAPSQELSYSNNANITTNGILPLPANYVTPNGTSYYAIPGNTGPQSSSTSGDANIGGNTNVGGSVSVGGNLSVSGTTTLKSTNTPAVNVLGQDTNGTVTQVTLGSGINLSGGVLSVDAGGLTQNISASGITAENIIVQTGSISSLSSQTGTITNLFSDMITAVKGVFDEIVTNILRARTAVIENIFSKNISTENLTATGVANFNMANFSGNVTFNNLPSFPLSEGALMVGDTGNKASELTAGSGGQVLVILNGTPVWTDATTVAPVISLFGRTGAVIAKTGDYNTSQVTESGSLYFTNTRARASISATGVVTYDSVNGVIGWNGTTDNVPEGGANLYYTESRFSGSLAAQKNIANGVAGLDANAKVSIMNLPGITMNSVWTAISQADCTTKTLATRGDICIATSDSKSYILSTTHYETQPDWQELLNPTAPVSQVNGQVGNINFIGTNGVTVSGTTISLTNIGTGGLYGSATKIPVITTDAQGRVTNVTETTIPTATAGQLGLLSPSDYVRFDAKQDFIGTGTTAQYYRGDKTWATLDTSVVGENGNLYFTVSRVRSSLSATGAITYNSSTGEFGDAFSFENGLSRNGNSISISTITGAKLSGFTSGRLTFGTASGGLTQSNNLFWDNINGRLGIGTMTPNSALNIVGDMEVTGKILNHGFDFVLGDGDQVSRGDSGYSRALVKNSGNRLSLNFNGDFAGGTTMGALFSQASGTGNIGIGTQAPGEKLEVIGNMKVSGGYLFGNNSYMGGDNGGNIELGGNNLTAGVGTPYIDFHYSGVTSDYNARIINSSSGRLDLIANTLYTNTKLGIGASAPTDALQVVGASRVGTAESYLRTYFDGSNIRIDNTGTGNIVMNYLNGKSVDIKNLLTTYLSVSGDINQRDANGDGFIMHSRGGNGYDFWQLAPSNSGTYDWSKGITLNRASGNVGIGNNAPSEKLSVFGNASFSNYTGGIIIYPGEFPSIAARNWANTVIGQMIFDTTNKKTLIDFDGAGGGDFSIRKALNSNADTVFRITSLGNVGIGTTTPSAQLSVSGSFLLANGTQGVGKILTSDTSGLATWSSLTGGFLSGFSAGQLTFGSASGGLTQSSNLFWDNTNTRLGIGTNSPQAGFHFVSTSTIPGFRISGRAIDNSNDTSGGVVFGMMHNDSTGNRQMVFGRTDDIGSASNGFVRFIGGGTPSLDAVTGNGGSRLKIQLGVVGDPSSGVYSADLGVNGKVGIGSTYYNSATLPANGLAVQGNVGIGTTSPNTKLEINSGVAGSGGLRFTQLLSSSASNSQYSGILGVNSTGDVGIAQLTGNSFTGFTAGQLAFGSASGGLSSTGGLSWNSVTNRFSVNGFVNMNNAVSTTHPLTIRANGVDVLAFQDNTGTTKWHWNLLGSGLNFVESGVADYRLFLQNGGNVGIGTSSPSYKLHVNGTAAGTSWTNTSDERFKTNISNISSGLDVINALRSVSYNWNALGKVHGGDIDKRQYGFIAQEVESLLPEIVNTDSEGYKSIDYIKIIPFLTKALQELAQNTASTGALSTLSGQVASLAGDITSLSGQVAILSQNTGSTVVNNYYNSSTALVQTGTTNTGELIDLIDMVATLSGSIASQASTLEQLQTQVDIMSHSIFSGSSYNPITSGSNDLTPLVWTHSGAILADLEASTTEPRNVLSYITNLFSHAIDVVRNFVALEITALRGYFDHIWAEQVTTDELTATDADIGTLHTDRICMKRSNGSEICINGDQLADMMNTPVAPSTSTPVAPVTPTEPTTNSGGSTEDTITEPTTNSDPTIIADPPVTDTTTVITPEAPVVDTESTDTDIVTP